MSPNVAIIMPYFDRQELLNNTLQSINNFGVKDITVVVVDDNSPKAVTIPEGLHFKTKILTIRDKYWRNPEPSYNKGIDWVIHQTDCEKIILQNPECYHEGDVITYTKENLTKDNYLTFACRSLNKKGHFDRWYNHSVHRPVALEFCAAIHRENLIALNGYDERLSFGIGYGDDYLLYRIKLMGLKVEIVDSVEVVHQWHPVVVQDNRKKLLEANKLLFAELKKTKEVRAMRFFTKGL